MSKYIGSRIVPKHCGTWSAAKNYDVLSVVLYAATGDSYFARKAMPTGVSITDTDYWAKAADFSAQLEVISNKVAALQTTADALAAQIAENVSASTDADADYAAEVVDARTDGDGNAYTSLGEAIRGQAAALAEQIADLMEQMVQQKILYDPASYNLDTNAYINTSTGEEVALTNNRYFSSSFIEIPSSAVEIWMHHAYAARFASIFFYDADQAYLGYDGYYTSDQLAGGTFSYTVPDGAAYFRFTHYVTGSFTGEVQVWYQNCDWATVKETHELSEENRSDIDSLQEEVQDARTGADGTEYGSIGEAMREQVSAIKEKIAELEAFQYEIDSWEFEENAYVDKSSGETVALTNNSYWTTGFIEIPENSQLIVLYHASVNSYGSIFFYDSEQAYLGYDGSYSENKYGGETASFSIPDGAAYFRFTHYKTGYFTGDAKVWYKTYDWSFVKELLAEQSEEFMAEIDRLEEEITNQTYEIDSSLYDPDTNCYISTSTGEAIAAGNSNYRCTGFIEVPDAAVKIILYYASAANFASIFFYDSDQAYIGYDGLYTANQLAGETIAFDIPDGAAYFRFTHFGTTLPRTSVKVWYQTYTIADMKTLAAKVSENTDAIEKNSERLDTVESDVEELTDRVDSAFESTLCHWNGKTANFLGDSITYGAYTPVGGSSPNQRADKRYCEIAGELLGMEVNNYAQSGISISSTSTQSPTSAMSLRYSIMSDDADLIVIMGGTNDFGTSVALGSSSDTTDVSFYGALRVLCDGLTEKYLGKRIVFITPILRSSEGSTNSDGHTLDEYRQAIYDITRDVYGFAVIDGKSLGLSPMNSTMRATYIVDGLHPNPVGHEVLGANLAHALKAI